MTLLPLSLLFAGCAPQDAEVTADYAIFLAATSSENINRLERTGTDVEGAPGKLNLTPIDCRDLSGLETDEEIEAARLGGVDYAASCCASGEGENCTEPIAPAWFTWLDDYAYYKNEGKVDAWRTEAVLTTEGDLQLTVHMDFPKFGDFRFGWVIDPTFQPKDCVDGAEGAEEVDVDGDWLQGWSAQEEKGTLWHLNSGAYQINPSDNGTAWYFEQEWQAGYTFARFADEEFYGHAVDYADEAYRPFYVNSYVGADDGQEGTAIPKPRGVNPEEIYNNWVESTEAFFADDVTDLATMGQSSFPLEMKIEDNSWRPTDDVASGLDGWLGVSPSWVRIDNPEAIEINNGTPITGEFQIYLEGLAAASKVLVRGTFSIDHVREDIWGFDQGTLEEVKREENNTPVCGDERLTTTGE
jgi:hypothetical protein